MLRFPGRDFSLKNMDNGVVGAGVNSAEPKDRLEGRRLPMDPFHLLSGSTLALVRTILGRLAHCRVRLRHIVGPESDQVEKKLEPFLEVLKFRGREGERDAFALLCGSLRRLFGPLWG